MNLALKFNNNYYYPLEKEFLDIIEVDNIDSLEGIDNFLKKYTKDEIIESIKRSNVVADEELLNNCEIVIIYVENKKIRELKTYTKDDKYYINFDSMDFLFKNFGRKNVINKLNNYFTSKTYLPEDLNLFAENLKSASIGQMINGYILLSYRSRRILKDYIYNEIVLNEEEKVLKKEHKEIQ